MKELISRKRICDSPIHFLKFLICQDELHDKDYVDDLYTKTFFVFLASLAFYFGSLPCSLFFRLSDAFDAKENWGTDKQGESLSFILRV